MRAAEKKFEAGVLLGSSFIQLDDGSEIAASVLLTPDGETYDGRLCRDPVEPDYDGGRRVGKIFWNEGFARASTASPTARSSGRSRTTPRRRPRRSTAPGAADTMTLALALAELERVERSQLVKRAAKALGLGNERQSLRDGVERQTQRIAAHAREHAARMTRGQRHDAGTVALGDLLASIGLPPRACAETGARTGTSSLSPTTRRRRPSSGWTALGYTAIPHEHHDIWAPCGQVTMRRLHSQAGWSRQRRITVEGSRSGRTCRSRFTRRAARRGATLPAAGHRAVAATSGCSSSCWSGCSGDGRARMVPMAGAQAPKAARSRHRGDHGGGNQKRSEQSFGTGRGTLFKIIEKLFGAAVRAPVGSPSCRGGAARAPSTIISKG